MTRIGNFLYLSDGLVHAVVERTKWGKPNSGIRKALTIRTTSCGYYSYDQKQNGLTKKTDRVTNCLRCVDNLGRY